MRARLTAFVQQLRAEGIAISIAETLDAMAAVERAGLDPLVLREALAASLVKDEVDRERFDAAFDAFFSAPPGAAGAGARRDRGGGGGGTPGAAGGGRSGGSGGGAPAARPPEDAPPPAGEARRASNAPPAIRSATARGARADERRPAAPAEKPRAGERETPHARPAEKQRAGEAPRPPRTGPASPRSSGARDTSPPLPRRAAAHSPAALARRREILRAPLDSLSPDDLDEARAVARELGRRFAARASRRERRQRTGRIDVRRTIRASLGHGGAMIALARRGRRPGKPRLVVLCDVSGSVARASELLLTLLSAAESAFRRVSRFVYVDRLVPIAFEDGHILPEGELDLWARSDFGAVLRDAESSEEFRLDRSTVLLVLGDARNNRRPPRADALKRLAQDARAVVWVVPEPRARWNTGDSALAAYAPACDLVLEATSLHALLGALRQLARR